MATLKSITVYEGRFILEYSRGAEGKTAGCFVVENFLDEPLPAGNSLNEAKRIIDALDGRFASWSSRASQGLGESPNSRENRDTMPQPAIAPSGSFPRTKVCPPQPATVVDDSILNALRDRISQDRESVCRIARFLSVHSGVILEWLAGTRRPRQATLERIAAYLKGTAVRA